MKMNDQYFANLPAEERAAVLNRKVSDWSQTLLTNGYYEKLRTMYSAYHGTFFDEAHQINFGGEQGELVELAINHMRNIAQHIINMITATRPSMQARSVNTDYKSLVQTKLANGLLDYYVRDHRLENYFKTAVEMAVVMGSGHIKKEWNATTGEVYDYNDDLGVDIREGDLEFSNLSPLDVYFDTHREDQNHDWVICRSFKNRHDLVAKFPEKADEILSVKTKDKMDNKTMLNYSSDSTTQIAVYEFYHKRTESVPDGVYQLFLENETSLISTALPYRELPIYTIAPSYFLGTPFGYTPMFDLLPIQEAVNSLYSTILTNQSAFGVQSIAVPFGSGISMSQLSSGLNVIQYNPAAGEIKPIQLTQTPKEIFDFIQMLEKAMETVSGVNSVSRGNPDPSLRSGNALALVQSMTLQFISGLQLSYVGLIEDLGTGMINTLKDHANVPRIAALVGKNNRTELKEFTGDDLSSINRVIVDIGNPLGRTTAGKMEIAANLLQMGAIKTPEQYFMVLNTGQLDVMTDDVTSQLFLIKSENERMIAKKPVAALITDEHALHIKEHAAVLSDPDLRFDQELFGIVSGHMQEHIDLLKNTDPNLLLLLGQQPLPPSAPPGMPPMPGAPMLPEAGGPPPMQAPVGQNMPQPTQLAQMDLKPNVPSIPSVDPSLLPNPELQAQSLGNIRQPQ
jgi:hypothetical protein